MQIITFNTGASLINRDSDSIAIRIAYLLGKKVAIAGNIVHDFSTNEIFAHSSFKFKIGLLEKIYNEKTNYNPGIDFEGTRQIIKKFAATKNKTTRLIAAYQRVERSITKIFNDVIKHYSDTILIASGFDALQNLIDEEIIKVFITSLSDEESERLKKIKPSDILSLNFDIENPIKLFLIQEHFFCQPFVDSYTYVDLNHPDANLPEVVMVEPLFTMPNLSSLKNAELTIMRNDLEIEMQCFNEKTETWINSINNKEDFEERKTILQTEISVIAKTIKDKLSIHPNIKQLEMVTDNEKAIEICIAEIPFQLLLDYHIHHKIIKEDTLLQLKKLQGKGPKFINKCPAIIYRRVASQSINLNSGANEATVPSFKKTITID